MIQITNYTIVLTSLLTKHYRKVKQDYDFYVIDDRYSVVLKPLDKELSIVIEMYASLRGTIVELANDPWNISLTTDYTMTFNNTDKHMLAITGRDVFIDTAYTIMGITYVDLQHNKENKLYVESTSLNDVITTPLQKFSVTKGSGTNLYIAINNLY